MNLTYDESGYFERTRSPEQNCFSHARVASVVQKVKDGGGRANEMQQLSDLGWIAAAAGAVNAAYGLFSGKKSKKDAAIAEARQRGIQENQAIQGDYKTVAGQVPGRVFGLSDMRKAMNALFDQGGLTPPRIDDKGTRKIWENMAADFIDAQGGQCATSGFKCPPGLVSLAKQNPNASAAQIVDMYAASNPYIAPDLQGGLERQVFIDAADAALAEVNPAAPITYGAMPEPVATQSAPAPVATSPNVSAPVVPQPVLTVDPATANIARQAVPGYFFNQAGASPQVSNDVDKLLESLRSQGATQAQMFEAATNALRAQGVNTQAPRVQEAIRTEVATAGTNYVPWIVGAAGVGLLAVLLLRKGVRR